MSSDFYKLIFFTVFSHTVLFIIDYVLKSLVFSKYLSFRKRNGIVIQAFRFSWFTTMFNRCIRRLGKWRPAFQKIWFSVGMWVTIPLFPLALYFLIQSVYVLFVSFISKRDKSDNAGTPFLEPAVPGINIPLSDTGYYVTALLICSIFHELGHAVASIREGAHVNGVGVFLLLMVPVVYVRMEGLENLSYDKQLRILCAGIWHNIILVAAATALLLLLPWLCYPIYQIGNGVQVVSVHENSPLSRVGGLDAEDVIFSINNCRVLDRDTWIKCLQRAAIQPPVGHCVSAEFIRTKDESVAATQSHDFVDCCGNETVSKICFEYLNANYDDTELPRYSCLKARSVIETRTKTCYSSEECVDLNCYRPSVSNGTKLMEIKRKNRSDVLFLGHPVEVLRDVNVSEFVKVWYLSVSIPNAYQKFCNFLIMFSGALATLNLTPCFHLDGQFIIRVLVDICLATRIRSSNVRLCISSTITVLGTCILVGYTTLILFSTFTTSNFY